MTTPEQPNPRLVTPRRRIDAAATSSKSASAPAGPPPVLTSLPEIVRRYNVSSSQASATAAAFRPVDEAASHASPKPGAIPLAIDEPSFNSSLAPPAEPAEKATHQAADGIRFRFDPAEKASSSSSGALRSGTSSSDKSTTARHVGSRRAVRTASESVQTWLFRMIGTLLAAVLLYLAVRSIQPTLVGGTIPSEEPSSRLSTDARGNEGDRVRDELSLRTAAKPAATSDPTARDDQQRFRAPAANLSHASGIPAPQWQIGGIPSTSLEPPGSTLAFPPSNEPQLPPLEPMPHPHLGTFGEPIPTPARRPKNSDSDSATPAVETEITPLQRTARPSGRSGQISGPSSSNQNDVWQQPFADATDSKSMADRNGTRDIDITNNVPFTADLYPSTGFGEPTDVPTFRAEARVANGPMENRPTERISPTSPSPPTAAGDQTQDAGNPLGSRQPLSLDIASPNYAKLAARANPLVPSAATPSNTYPFTGSQLTTPASTPSPESSPVVPGSSSWTGNSNVFGNLNGFLPPTLPEVIHTTPTPVAPGASRSAEFFTAPPFSSRWGSPERTAPPGVTPRVNAPPGSVAPSTTSLAPATSNQNSSFPLSLNHTGQIVPVGYEQPLSPPSSGPAPTRLNGTIEPF